MEVELFFYCGASPIKKSGNEQPDLRREVALVLGKAEGTPKWKMLGLNETFTFKDGWFIAFGKGVFKAFLNRIGSNVTFFIDC